MNLNPLFDARRRIMFTFLNDSFRIYTTNGIRKIENGKFLWQQAILFSSNQCLIDRSVGNDFENCARAWFMCAVNNTIVLKNEKRTYEEALKECETMNGNLCEEHVNLYYFYPRFFRYAEFKRSKQIPCRISKTLDRSQTRKVIASRLSPQFGKLNHSSMPTTNGSFLSYNQKVNQSHFKSSSLNSYFNITRMIDHEQLNHNEFPSVVTCTIDGKLQNKIEDTVAVCICKVGNMKLNAFILLFIITIISIAIFMFCYFT